MTDDRSGNWATLVLNYWQSNGVNPQQAQELLTELCLRYSRRRLLPAWGQGVPPPALWRLAHDLLCEHWRRQRRAKQQLDALQAQCLCTPAPIFAREVDARLFLDDLPPRLQEVLALRLQGETCEQIARCLGIGVGTVKSYLKDLRANFIAFFGYDPTKRRSASGYINGKPHRGQKPKEEVRDHEAHSSDDDRSGSPADERGRPAPYSRRSRRRAGGLTPQR